MPRTPTRCCCWRGLARGGRGRRWTGLTLFFTDLNRDRCTIRKIDKLGRPAVDSNEVFIDGLEVPDEDVVGEVGAGSITCSTGSTPSGS